MDEKLVVEITAEISDLKKGLKNAKEDINDAVEKTKKSSKEINESFKNIGNSVKDSLKKASLAIAGVGTALIGLGASTKDYRNTQAKLITAFKTMGSSARQAKKTYNDLYRVLGDDEVAVEASNHLAKLGVSSKDLSEWTTICTGVYATFGDSLPIEGLTEAANETAKTGELTGVLTDALNWAGVSEDSFKEKLEACNTEAEREKLIRETLNGLYTESAKKFEENNAQVIAQNEAQSKLKETLATLGTVVAPIVTLFTQFATNALALVVPYIQQLAENYMPILQEILGVVSETLGQTLEFITEHSEILAVILEILGGLIISIEAYNAVMKIKALMDAAQVTTLKGLTLAYLAQAKAMLVAIAPYAAIVAAIAAVIAIIVVCIKHWDEIKAKCIEVWEKIKDATSRAVDYVIEKFENFKNSISEKFNYVKEKTLEVFTNIRDTMVEKLTTAKDTVIGIFTNIKDTIKRKIEDARDAVKNAIDRIKAMFKFTWSLPHLKLPHIRITGHFSLKPPSAPHFSVSWYAKGGVFDNPLLFGYGNGMLGGLGENGAEAVVPLEKNTEWLDRIAERLATRNNAPIYLMVDKRVLAKSSVEGINDITKQTGVMPLTIA